MTNSTIVAISTPTGTGGIAIIRLSGPSAISIADEFFCAKSGVKLKDAQHAKMNFGTFNLKGVQEKGYAVVFFAPNSFTGELVVEMQVHGGSLIAETIVKECVARGAKIAGKGDFSKRAFINGRASLDSLEGMIDMISAESEAELKAASSLYSGKLKEKVEQAENILLEAVAGIDVGIDYPDEVEEEPTIKETYKKVQEAKKIIAELLKQKKQSHMLKDGVYTLILGKPNVGKSSVLNAILGENRAIVTDIAGTTRDIIKETFVYDDVKFQILDTAGIRDTKDIIEKIGVDRAKENIARADLVLFIIDALREIENEDKEILNLVKDKNLVAVLNKTDKKVNATTREFFNNIKAKKVEISAACDKGIDNLLFAMKQASFGLNAPETILLNQRHIEALESTENELAKVKENQSLDILAFSIKSALNFLGSITGRTASEEVVNKIFSKFCVGK